MAQVTGYCHIGSHRGGVPSQVLAGGPDNGRGAGGGGAQPNEDVI